MKTLLLSLLVVLPTAAAAQQAPVAEPVILPDESSPDDVVVRALRIPREKLPVEVRWDYFTSLQSRAAYQQVERYINCAVRISPIRFLREAVDGTPNTPNTSFAQGVVSTRNTGCGTTSMVGEMPFYGHKSETDYGRSQLQRGAIIDAVLREYAPDASLTVADVTDPKVRSRFLDREGWRNRLRFPQDLDALRVASCMIETSPGFATRIVRANPGSQLEQGLMQSLIISGRDCVRGAASVTIDPTSMRGYVVDAFYRWVVAARNVDTLVPTDRG